MKTKHTFISVLMILAMVTTLVVVAAAPASATVATVAGAAHGNVTVGSSVTITETTGAFIPGAPLTFLWGRTSLTPAAAAPIATTPVAVAASEAVATSGQLLGASIKVPATPPAPAGDTYSVWVTDGVVAVPYSVTMSVISKLVASPTQAAIGDTVSLIGTGFAANVGVSITKGGVPVASATTDATGSFNTTMVASAANIGALVAQDLSAGGATNTATATVTVKAGISLSATEQLPGKTVTVTGTNFTALTLTATVGGAAATLTTTGTPAAAYWTATLLIPAAATSGVNQVVVTDGTATAVTSITVSGRTLTLTPSSGPSGTRVTVMGSSLTPTTAGVTQVVSVTASPFSAASLLAGAPMGTDSIGQLVPATFTVNNGSTVGANAVAVRDIGADGIAANADDLTASAVFTVTRPVVTISPATGYSGSTTTVSGTGFLPGSIVTVSANGVAKAYATADSTGAFHANAVVTGNVVTPASITALDTAGNTNAGIGVPLVLYTFTATGFTIEPTTVAGGNYVTATGVAFDRTDIVTFRIGAATLTTKSQVITNSVGDFTAEVFIPGLTPGAVVITASTTGGVTRNAFITITPAAATPDVVTVADGLVSIMDKLAPDYVIWSFDNQTKEWTTYTMVAGAPANTLTNLSKSQVIYVEVTEDVIWTHQGASIQLYAGWNAVPGLPS